MTGEKVRFRHYIIFNIDGCRIDLLHHMMENGKLPVISAIFGNGAFFEKAETVFPTITLPTQTSAVTGAYPSSHGILMNMWMDRKKPGAPVYNYVGNAFDTARVYKYELIGFPGIFFSDNRRAGYLDEHMPGKIHTIYQKIRSCGFSSITAFHQIGRGADLWIRPKPADLIRYFFSRWDRNQFVRFDESMISRVVKEIETAGEPGILYVYFAPSDTTDHLWGIRGQEWYLEKVVERNIGRILRSVEKSGGMDSTLFIAFADHGHSDIEQKHRISMKQIRKIMNKSSYHKNISATSSRNQNAVVTLQGGMAGFYLKNLYTGKWKDTPEEEQILDLCGVFEKESDEIISGILYKSPTAKKYMFHTDRNPMGIDIPAMEKKINREFYHRNGPDLILFSNYSGGYYFYHDPVRSIHGNIHPGDFHIPLIFAGRGIRNERIGTPAQIVDIAPTILKALGVSPGKISGKPLPIWD